MHDIPIIVGQNLNLDMARALDVFLEIDPGILECLFSFRTGRLKSSSQRDFVPGYSHPFATTTSGGFDQDRVTDSIGDTNGLFDIRDQAITARYAGHARSHRDFSSTDLVTELLHCVHRRSDEFNIATAADFGKVRVFSQETVAWMYSLHVPDFSRADDSVNLQVAFQSLRRPDAPGFVSQFQIMRASIGFAVNSDRFNPQFPASPDNSQGNLTSVRDQNSLKHGVLSSKTNKSAGRSSGIQHQRKTQNPIVKIDPVFPKHLAAQNATTDNDLGHNGPRHLSAELERFDPEERLVEANSVAVLNQDLKNST